MNRYVGAAKIVPDSLTPRRLISVIRPIRPQASQTRYSCRAGPAEVSGVSTHPHFRGRGLARRLSRHVAAGIAGRGDTAFLHAWQTNTAAIHLYESLGFRLRCEVNVAVLDTTPG